MLNWNHQRNRKRIEQRERSLMENSMRYLEMVVSKWLMLIVTEVKDGMTGSVVPGWDIRTLYQLVTQVKCKTAICRKTICCHLVMEKSNVRTLIHLRRHFFDGYNIIEAGDIVLRLTDLQNDHTV